MRPLALLLPLLVVLSACAPINGRPNGWGLPGDLTPGPRVSTPSSRDAARRGDARGDARGAEDAPERRVAVVHDTPADRRTPAPATASGLLIPVADIAPNRLRDSFHAPRSGGRTHHAIDIAAPTGTPLVAVTDGTITRKHWNRLGGNTLYLRSADGRYDFYYAHLDGYAEGVEIGTVVRKGDVIGTVGATGNAQGPHLHFQVLDLRGDGRGTPVNPYDLLRAADVVRLLARAPHFGSDAPSATPRPPR